MAINDNLFKAILAMDSYNRGYNQGIIIPDNMPIGNATVFKQSDIDPGTKGFNIDFYAIAYNYNGEKIISYRGTDNLGSDFLTGYGVGGGNPKEAQARMAFEFFQAVAGASVDPRNATNISLTGHSLGGGLAGLVGSVYGKTAMLFDNMAFEGAALNTKVFSLTSSGNLYDASFKNTVYGSRTPWDPTISGAATSKIQTYYVDGEFLSLPATPGNHALQTTPQHKLEMGTGVNLPGVDSGLFGDGRHSIASLAILLYADPSTGMNVGTAWKAAAHYFWPVLYNDDFIENIYDFYSMEGTLANEGKYSAVLRTALAYSIINEGQRIFGDTGIVSFYHDANALGAAASSGPSGTSPSSIGVYGEDISKVFVQYAGLLALNKILQSEHSDVLDGVLVSGTGANNNTLTVDLSDVTWDPATNGDQSLMAGRAEMVNHILADASMDRVHLWKGYDWYPDKGGYFDRAIFAQSDSGSTTITDGAAGRATLFVAGSGSDIITGSSNDDLIIGREGFDKLSGDGGNDILAGGIGDDILNGGAGDDRLYGGLGNNTLDGGGSAAGGDWASYINSSFKASADFTTMKVSHDVSYTDTILNISNVHLTRFDDTVKMGNTALTVNTDLGFDTVSYQSLSHGVTVSLYSSGMLDFQNTQFDVDKGGGAVDHLFLPDKIIGTAYNDAFNMGKFGAREWGKIIFDGGAGIDTVQDWTNLRVNADGVSNIYGLKYLNVDTFLVSGQDIEIAALGHKYDYTLRSRLSASYSEYASALNLTMNGLSLTVAQKTGGDGKVDNFTFSNMPYFTLYGGNYGDTFKDVKASQIWLGKGNDVITQTSGTPALAANVWFTKGNDIIEHASKIALHFGPDILPSDVSVSEVASRNIGQDSGGILQSFDLKVSVTGHGSILLMDNFRVYNPTYGTYSQVTKASIILPGTETVLTSPYTDDQADALKGGGGDDILHSPGAGDMDGGSGNDVLFGPIDYPRFQINGGDGNDTIYGLGSATLGPVITDIDSYLFGDDGNDKIFAGSGVDALFGGRGDDVLISGAGQDTLNGGEGADIFKIRYEDGSVSIADFQPGIDKIDIQDFAAYTRFDQFVFETGGRTASSLTGSFELDPTVFSTNILLGEGVGLNLDNIDPSQLSPSDFIFRGQPNPYGQAIAYVGMTLEGTDVADSLSGRDADDTIKGGNGDDYLFGRGGNDILNGGAGNDYLSGSTGENIMDGGLGDDILYGSHGADIYIMSAGNDIIDEFEPGPEDILLMPNGITLADLSFIRINVSDLLISVGTIGTVRVEYQFDHDAYIPLEKIKFADGSILSLEQVTAVYNGTADDDRAWGVTFGGSHNDIMNGNDGNDVLNGEDGNDILNGGNGNDVMGGGEGSDTINGGAGNDGMSGEEGNDFLTGGSGDDSVSGGTGDDTLYSGLGKDDYFGDEGIDTVNYSNAGSAINVSLIDNIALNDGDGSYDTLWDIENIIGSAFADSITGNRGNNNLTGGNGNDVINGGKGDDTLIGGAGTDTLSYVGMGAVTISLALATAQSTSGAGIDIISGFENLIGSASNDILTGSLGNNVIDGGSGNDTISGGSGNDTLIGGIGTDTLSYANDAFAVNVNLSLTTAQNTGGAGTDTVSGFENLTGSAFNDTLNGNSGNNVIDGGNGNDLILGGAGNDTLKGGSGTDTLSYTGATSAVTISLALTTAQATGGAGTDTVSAFENLIGSSFNDKLTGSSGNNTIEGGAGNDTLNGGAGTDTLSYASATSAITVSLALTTAQVTGGAGTDTVSAFENLTGSVFNDKLTGSTGVNTIRGGAGVDTIDGGTGNDILYGDAGADILTGGAGLDRFVFDTSLSGSDTIKDFNKAEDILDLSSLLTAYDPVTDAITNFVQITNSGTNSIVKVDLDGTTNGQAWTQIATLTGVTGLTDEQALANSGHLIM